uniref:Uncharacterized protein n=1 Tax=Picea glauca TaxID=3330 RepID=A0A101LYD7_PICGL|nr:hypothetical protein ABT39_MTgene5781 [Picea glauca]QHR90446.1 hypothetical protein Q903MT_gene4470 [Picea sitchensis]
MNERMLASALIGASKQLNDWPNPAYQTDLHHPQLFRYDFPS